MYPQVDLQVMGGAEGLAAVRAVLGGRAQGALSMLGQRRLDAPRCLHQVLANIWSTHTHTHEEGKTNGRRVECQPCTHHIITQHILPLCPSFPALGVRTPHKVKRIKRVHGPRCFPPDRTLTVHKLSSETPPHNLLLFFFFYPGCCRRSR